MDKRLCSYKSLLLVFKSNAAKRLSQNELISNSFGRTNNLSADEREMGVMQGENIMSYKARNIIMTLTLLGCPTLSR